MSLCGYKRSALGSDMKEMKQLMDDWIDGQTEGELMDGQVDVVFKVCFRV